ncbi:MAG: RNase adaptor protein RapZ [Sorangiineae bacterium NIC37A_2]|nr:MAG: RNase adaptor protein RapZ [Sorangiineae bacterium NIC37A_2]
MMEPGGKSVLIVTGMSGAGKTVAVNALEDLGFFCVDNLPPPVVEATISALHQAGETRIAFGIDVRVRDYLELASPMIDALSAREDFRLFVLYLDASDELLSRRFSATRRPHPLTARGARGARALFDGIRKERELMAPLRGRATAIVDTTNLTVHELRREVMELFRGAETGNLIVRIVSFGFKYGAPRDADIVLDVRFLPNPHFDDRLRPLSGLDADVRDFVLGQTDAAQFLRLARALVEFCIPRFLQEGKSYATIALGCTGGRHRSVALAQELAENLLSSGSVSHGIELEASHRDLHRPEHFSDPPGRAAK